MELREAGASCESVPRFNYGLKVRTVFEGTNPGPSPVSITLAKATLVTAREMIDLLVKGTKGESFTRVMDSPAPKRIEYGAILPPRFPPGTRFAVAFELEVEGVRKTLRSGILIVEKKE